MKERLDEIVRIFKERDTVRKIQQAKDFEAVYEEEKAAMSEQLESFKHEVQDFIDDDERPFSTPSEFCYPENVVEICFILCMSRVDDVDLTDKYEDIEAILDRAPEDMQKIARRFSKFLCKEGACFSEYTEEELLEELLL